VEPVELLEQALGGRLPPSGLDRFEQYRRLILDWNRNLHLISSRDEALLVSRHFLESVGLTVVLDIPSRAKVMDLGSGPGFPGIPLAIVRPDLEIILAESVAKRAGFLRCAVEALGLDRVSVICDRAESSHDNRRDRDWVFSRAVADCDTLARWSKGWVRSRGRLIAFKGTDINEELKRFEKTAAKRGVQNWKVVPYDPFPDLVPVRGVLVEIMFQ
jgi:16S rRNA (guanine527-N7)-methyltransferase